MMLEDEGSSHPFTAVYFDRLSQWSKLPWVVGRLTAPGVVDDYDLMALFARLNLSYVLPLLGNEVFDASGEASDAVVDATTSLVLHSECCGRTVRWRPEWSQYVISGRLVQLTQALADCFHSNRNVDHAGSVCLCPWHTQAGRVLAGANSMLVPARCAAVPLEEPPAGTWRLPISMASSTVTTSAAHLRDKWCPDIDGHDDAETACIALTMYGLVCSSLRRRAWAVEVPHRVNPDDEALTNGGVAMVPVAELPTLYQDILAGGACRLGATEAPLRCLECLHCGRVTSSVGVVGDEQEATTARAACDRDASNTPDDSADTNGADIAKPPHPYRRRFAVGLTASHHPWCAWRKMFLERVLAVPAPAKHRAHGVAMDKHRYALGTSCQLIVEDAQDAVATLAAVLLATKTDETDGAAPPLVMRHPCWSVVNPADAARTVVAYRAVQHPSLYQRQVPESVTVEGASHGGACRTVTTPAPTEAVLRCVLRRGPSTAVPKGLILSGPWVSLYTKLRDAVALDSATVATRKRPRSADGEENQNHDDAMDAATTADSVPAAVRVLHECHAFAVSKATAKPPTSIVPTAAETIAWDTLRLALGVANTSTAPHTGPHALSTEETSMVDKYLASVRQAVADGQLPRRAAPPRTDAQQVQKPIAAQQPPPGAAGSTRAVAPAQPQTHHVGNAPHHRSVAPPAVLVAPNPPNPFRPQHQQHLQHHAYTQHHHQHHHHHQHGFPPAFQGVPRGQPASSWNVQHQGMPVGGMWDAPPSGAALFATPPAPQPIGGGSGILGRGGYGGGAAAPSVLGHHHYGGNQGPFAAPTHQPPAAPPKFANTAKQPVAPSAPLKPSVSTGGGSKQPQAPAGGGGGAKHLPAPGAANKQSHGPVGNASSKPPPPQQQQVQQQSVAPRGRGGRGGRGGGANNPPNQQLQDSHRGGRGGNKRR